LSEGGWPVSCRKS